MGIHRTELLQTLDGYIRQVDYHGVYEHQGDIRDAILRLKYDCEKSEAMRIARLLHSGLDGLGTCDVATWAPTTAQRRMDRGFDQSELIARHLASLLRVKHARLLRRDNDGRQTGSGRTDRLARPSFKARPGIPGKHVWIIDDVMTTGATMRAAAEAIVHAGACRVTCIAVSYVP